MGFEWDEEKNKSNYFKHGITFEEATEIFNHPTFTVTDDRMNYGELREISIGMIGISVVIVVVHTDRNGARRLISARKANQKERRIYDGYLQETFKRN